MNMSEPFQRFSTGLSLLVLAIGFSSLGFASYVNGFPNDEATMLFSEASFYSIGSFVSLFVGVIFLIATVLFAATIRREKRPFLSEWRKSTADTMD
jgi:ABC-type transport system involved in multi-copper enzyme maturation permease subunit